MLRVLELFDQLLPSDIKGIRDIFDEEKSQMSGMVFLIYKYLKSC